MYERAVPIDQCRHKTYRYPGVGGCAVIEVDSGGHPVDVPAAVPRKPHARFRVYVRGLEVSVALIGAAVASVLLSS